MSFDNILEFENEVRETYVPHIFKPFLKDELLILLDSDLKLDIKNASRMKLKQLYITISKKYQSIYEILKNLNIKNIRKIITYYELGISRYKEDLIENIINHLTKEEKVLIDGKISYFLSLMPMFEYYYILNKHHLLDLESKSNSAKRIQLTYNDDLQKLLTDYRVDELKKFCSKTIIEKENHIFARLSKQGNKDELINRLSEYYLLKYSSIYQPKTSIEVIDELNEEDVPEIELISNNDVSINEKYELLVKKQAEFEKVNNDLVNRIIEELKKGVKPWKKTWTSIGIPKNLISKKEYTLGNILYLLPYIELYQCPYFATKIQIENNGGKIMPDAVPIKVAYKYKGKKKIKVQIQNDSSQKTNDGKPNDKNDEEKEFVYTFYNVFELYNYKQTYGLERKYNKLENSKHQPTIFGNLCEQVISYMPNRPIIEYQIDVNPAYNYELDKIKIPQVNQFKIEEFYYSTLFHELSHSTGHSKRLNREINNVFGTPKYADEELVAELSASILCAHCYISNETFNHNVSYIDNWLNVLQQDPSYLWSKILQAQKSADYILGIEEKKRILKQNETIKRKINKLEWQLIKKIRKNNVPLSSIYYIHEGYTPTINENIIESKNSNQLQKPLIAGNNISRFRITLDNHSRKLSDDKLDPIINKLFDNQTIFFKNDLEGVGILAAINNNKFYADSSVLNAVNWGKIKMLRMHKIDSDVEVSYYNKIENLFVLAIVSSKVLSFYYNKLKSKGSNSYKKIIKTLPIPNITIELQHPLILLVEKILTIKENNLDTNRYEGWLDLMVYYLFSLTFEEVKIIDSEFKFSKENYDNFKFEKISIYWNIIFEKLK